MGEETIETWFRVEERRRIFPRLLTEWMNNGSRLYVLPDFDTHYGVLLELLSIESCLYP